MQEVQLAGWVVEEAKRRGGSITRPVAARLVDRVGGSQQLLSSEIDKLLTYSLEITAESVELLTEPSPRSSIFDLLESAFAGRTDRMLALYREQRAQKVEPQAILSMIAWQLHALTVTKLGGGKSPQEIASISKLSPYTVRNSQSLARSLSLAKLQALIGAVISLEITLKSKALNADDAVQVLLLQIVAI
jgi:DNA polymerase III delta subunit